MKWTDRLRLTWNAFKRELLPLYAWLLLFVIGAFILILILFATVLGSMLSPLLFTEPDVFSDPFATASTMASPGKIIITFLSVAIIGWLGVSAINTGLFNLTQKAIHEKVRLKDFRFLGLKRLLGWEAILFLIFITLTAIGVVLFAFNQTVILVIYILIVAAFILVTLPWWSVAGFYLLSHREQSFKLAMQDSWAFYRRHMGALWGLILIILVIQLILTGISEISPGASALLSLVAGPFVAMMPIVWTLSLDQPVQAPEPYSASPDTDRQNLNEQLLSSQAVQPSVNSEIQTSEDASQAQPPEMLPPEAQLSEVPENQEFQNNATEVTNNQPERSCPSCGRQIKSDTNYCSQCGTKL